MFRVIQHLESSVVGMHIVVTFIICYPKVLQKVYVYRW